VVSSRRASDDGVLTASHFRRGGQSLNQQIEIAKLVAACSRMEDRRSLDSSFSTAILHIFKRKSTLTWISTSSGE
jgi:hypothetical protein